MRFVLTAVALALAAAAAIYSVRHNRGSGAATSGATNHILAPDFTLPQLDGQMLRLSTYRGKVVLLDFWATWCGPCIQAVPELKEIRKKFANRPFELISISVDREKRKLEDFVKANEMTWPQYFDEGYRVAKDAFGVATFPSYFVLDGEGVVTYVLRGYSPTTAARLTAAVEKAFKTK